MHRSGLFAVLTLAAVSVVSGLIGYNAGLTSTAVAAGATVVVTGGFPGFGTLLFLFFLFFMTSMAFGFSRRKRAWMAGHDGQHGHGPWGAGRPGGSGFGPGCGPMGNPADPRRQWVAEMHRRLHEDEVKGTGTSGNPAGPAGSTGPGANSNAS